MVSMKERWVIGVDEAGRGPLAGPVAVGVACVPEHFDFSLVGDVRDSKQLSEKARERVYREAVKLRRQGVLDFTTVLTPVVVINERGIVFSVQSGISRAIARLKRNPEEVSVRLDGLLRAPKHFIDQKTITGGDRTEKAIALASILAKVRRDRYMVRAAKKYPKYQFEVHKGYGTKMHRDLIVAHGPCGEHRTLYIRKVVK